MRDGAAEGMKIQKCHRQLGALAAGDHRGGQGAVIASKLLASAKRVRPELQTFGSPTCSDWVFVRDTDAIKFGPGTSRQSHTPDECVDLAEVTAAREFYLELAKDYLR